MNIIPNIKPMEPPAIPEKTDLLIKLEEKYPVNQYHLFWHKDIEKKKERIDKISQDSVFIPKNGV